MVVVFLPRSKGLLISWLQSPSSEILEPPKMKSDAVSIVSPPIYHEVMGPGVGDGQGGLVCRDSWGHRVGYD